MLRALFVATAAVLATAPAVSAQATGCEDAAARISTNTLPRVGAPQWNDWVMLTGCGNRGATIIAAALRSDGIRTESELTRLDHLTNLLDGWFQPSLVSAYQSLLKTPDASNAVRLRAMWLLGGLYAPNVDVAGPLQGYMSARCEQYDRVTSLRDAPNSLPATAYEQARDAMAYAANDGSAPEYVRSTARCWEGLVSSAVSSAGNNAGRDMPADDRNVVVETSGPAPVVVEHPVRVVYECDNRFVFYNDAGYDLAIRYGGYGSSGMLRLSHGGPYVWAGGRFGSTRFWVGDEEVFYSNVVYRPCGGVRVIIAPAIYPWYAWHAGLGIFLGPRIYVGSRYIVPRAIVPRYVAPRSNHPVIVVPRRGGDNRREDHNQAGRGGDNRREEHAQAGRGNDDHNRNDHPNGGGNAQPRGQGAYAVPRGQGGNAAPPRQAEQHSARPAQSPGSAPVGRPTNEQRRERIAAPQGGNRGGDRGGNRSRSGR